MKKNNVILCGSNYGSVYIDVIDSCEHLKLVGVLSKGSTASQNLALQNNVPLITTIEDNELNPDIAIVSATASANQAIASSFLERGVKVLLEHPISSNDLKRVIESSEKGNTPFLLNTHFPYSKPARKFIEKCNFISTHSNLEHIEITVNSRTLFSMLDILTSILPTNDIEISSITRTSEKYCLFILKSGNVSITVNYQNWINLHDDSSDCPVGHAIRAIFTHGNLSMMGSFGPLMWSPVYSKAFPPSLRVNQLAHIENLKQDIIDLRINANIFKINELLNIHNTNDLSCEYALKLKICELWEELTSEKPQVLETTNISEPLWKIF